jgi:hypothetical protein
MTYSRPLLGTDTKKTKLSWFKYIWFSCIQQGGIIVGTPLMNWSDLMGNSYQDYELILNF